MTLFQVESMDPFVDHNWSFVKPPIDCALVRALANLSQSWWETRTFNFHALRRDGCTDCAMYVVQLWLPLTLFLPLCRKLPLEMILCQKAPASSATRLVLRCCFESLYSQLGLPWIKPVSCHFARSFPVGHTSKLYVQSSFTP
jgi:hypothetical protein